MKPDTFARAALAGLVGLALWQPAARAADKEVDHLIDLLVLKNAVTADEASALRAQSAREAQSPGEKKSDPGVAARVPLRIAGYSQFQYRAGVLDAAGKRVPDTFLFRRGRLSLLGSIAPDLEYKAQVEITGSSKVITAVDFAGQKSTSGLVGRPLLVDLLAGYRLPKAIPSGRLQAGQFKIPFSIDNLISSSDLETINRSQIGDQLVPGRDIGAQGRDIGVQTGAGLSGSKGRRVADITVGLFNGAGINVADDNSSKDVAARVVVTPVAGISLGASGYAGRAGARGLRHNRAGAEVAWRQSRWWGRGEYIQGRGNGKEDERRKQGWYALTGFDVTRRVQVLARYDTFDPDRSVRGDGSNILTLGTNWLLGSRSKLRLNYDFRGGARPRRNAFYTQYQVAF